MIYAIIEKETDKVVSYYESDFEQDFGGAWGMKTLYDHVNLDTNETLKNEYNLKYYPHIYDLETVRRNKIIEIDNNTDSIISKGITFNNKVFGLSATDQANYNGLDQLRNEISYPFIVKCKDKGTYYSFISAEELHNFALAVSIHLHTVLNSGWNLTNSVIDASSIAEINNIKDNRE